VLIGDADGHRSAPVLHVLCLPVSSYEQPHAPLVFHHVPHANFLGSSCTADFTVFKSALLTPLLLPQGGGSAVVQASQPFYLSVNALLPSCLVLSAGSALGFLWSIEPTVDAAAIELHNPQLIMPAFRLSGGTAYTFTLTARLNVERLRGHRRLSAVVGHRRNDCGRCSAAVLSVQRVFPESHRQRP
jgi:hypothetical protein